MKLGIFVSFYVTEGHTNSKKINFIAIFMWFGKVKIMPINLFYWNSLFSDLIKFFGMLFFCNSFISVKSNNFGVLDVKFRRMNRRPLEDTCWHHEFTDLRIQIFVQLTKHRWPSLAIFSSMYFQFWAVLPLDAFFDHRTSYESVRPTPHTFLHDFRIKK